MTIYNGKKHIRSPAIHKRGVALKANQKLLYVSLGLLLAVYHGLLTWRLQSNFCSLLEAKKKTSPALYQLLWTKRSESACTMMSNFKVKISEWHVDELTRYEK